LEQGINIDLSRLPSPGLSHDGKIMTVSPARKWDDLYDELDPLNLTVVGGRVAGVGVGGLVLGCKSIPRIPHGNATKTILIRSMQAASRTLVLAMASHVIMS